jgi:hypothetical protein
MANQFFPYKRDNRWWLLFALLGLKDSDGVTLTDTELVATYGRYQLRTPLTNVKYTEITGPHLWYKAVGIRLSVFDQKDDGLTFSCNHYKGMTIGFVTPVPKVTGLKPQHSYLWVSAADCEGLVKALEPYTSKHKK